MEFITRSQLSRLLNVKETPCVSLYQPTHRHHPETQQDRVRFRNLATRIEKELADQFTPAIRNPMLERIKSLERNEFFWRNRTEGLVVLCSPQEFHTYDLQHSTHERTVVADSFHLKPLLRHVQSADTYQVVALTRNSVKLYEGNRYALDQIELKGVPESLKEALGEKLTPAHLTVAAYSLGASKSEGRGDVPPAVHGQGSRKDEVDIDLDRYYRIVDKALLDQHSKPSGHSLILAALPENQGRFRRLSQNPHLLSDGITSDPDKLSKEEIRQQSWKLLEPIYRERLRKLTDEFAHGKSKGIACDGVEDSAHAAAQGRIARVLIDADRHVAGQIGADGTVQINADKQGTHLPDVLDDIGECVLRTGGEVIVVPSELMPTKSGVAALLRF